LINNGYWHKYLNILKTIYKQSLTTNEQHSLRFTTLSIEVLIYQFQNVQELLTILIIYQIFLNWSLDLSNWFASLRVIHWAYLETKHKNIWKCEPKLNDTSLYCKIITETLVGWPLCNSFNLENREWYNCKTMLLIILW